MLDYITKRFHCLQEMAFLLLEASQPAAAAAAAAPPIRMTAGNLMSSSPIALCCDEEVDEEDLGRPSGLLPFSVRRETASNKLENFLTQIRTRKNFFSYFLFTLILAFS